MNATTPGTRLSRTVGIVVLLFFAPVPAASQSWVPSGKQAPPVTGPGKAGAPYPGLVGGALVPALPRSISLAMEEVPETEPNDETAEANLIALGDQVTGTIDPAGDVDYFQFDAPASTFLDLDVDAAELGSELDAVIALFDVDGETVLAVNDDENGLDSRIRFVVAAAGRYYVGITDLGGSGSAGHTYTLKVGEAEFEPTEVEPNDAAGQANSVALGEEATGFITPEGDVDFYAVDVPGGTFLDLQVEASAVGSHLDALLTLFDEDGVTVLAQNDDFNGLDSRIRHLIPSPGRYFVSIRDLSLGGGSGHFYSLGFAAAVLYPGDPTVLFASGFQGPSGMAFDTHGEMFVAEHSGQVSRVTPTGTRTLFRSGIISPQGVAFDGFGRLLSTSGDGSIHVVPSAGDPSPLITGLGFPFDVAVGPDGDIWVAAFGNDGARVSRYDPSGVLEQSFDVSTVGGARYLAFSPAGELYFSNGFDAVFRLASGQPVPFIQADQALEGLAFDRDGNLYVANGFLGEVSLYASDGSALEVPLASTNLGGPIDLAFGRDADGSTNARLFASNLGFNLQPPYAGGIVELNSAGIRAPGWPVAVMLPPDFTIAATPSSITTTRGATASYTVTVAPVGDSFDDAVQFSCSGLPDGASCAFSPNPVTPGTGTATTTVSVTTTAAAPLLRPGFEEPLEGPPPPVRLDDPLWVLLALLLGAGILLAARTREPPPSPSRGGTRARQGVRTVVAVLLLGAALSSACGDDGMGPSGPSTPAGTYEITITATSGATSHPTAVMLVVQ